MIMVQVGTATPAVAVSAVDGPDQVVVRAPGCLTRLKLDRLLEGAGAGRFPGHHVELRVSWLRTQSDIRPELFAEWLRAAHDGGLIDDSGGWVMAAVEWDEGWIPLAS